MAAILYVSPTFVPVVETMTFEDEDNRNEIWSAPNIDRFPLDTSDHGDYAD